MFVLGLILVLIALVVILFVVFATRNLPSMEIDWTIFTAQLSPLELYLLGAGTVLVLAVGTALLLSGLRRQGAKRAEMRRLRKEVKSTSGTPGTRTDDRGRTGTTSTGGAGREGTTATGGAAREGQARTTETGPRATPAQDGPGTPPPAGSPRA